MSDTPLERPLPDDLLELYLVGGMPIAMAAQIEELLRRDPKLRERLAELRALRTEFLMADPPAQFAHRVVAKVELERRREKSPGREWREWLLPFGGAVAVGLVMVTLMVPQVTDDPFDFGFRSKGRGESPGGVPEVVQAEAPPSSTGVESSGGVESPVLRTRRKPPREVAVLKAPSPVPVESRSVANRGAEVGEAVATRGEKGTPILERTLAGLPPPLKESLKLEAKSTRGRGPVKEEMPPMRFLSAPILRGGGALAEPSDGTVEDMFFRPVFTRGPAGSAAVRVTLRAQRFLMVVGVAGGSVTDSSSGVSVLGKAGLNLIVIPEGLLQGERRATSLFLVTGEEAFSPGELRLVSGEPRLRQGWVRTDRIVGASDPVKE